MIEKEHPMSTTVTDIGIQPVQPVETCQVCGRRELVQWDRGLAMPYTTAVRDLARRCEAAGHKSKPVLSHEELDPPVDQTSPLPMASADRLWALPDLLVVRPLGRRTVRAHRDPSVLHIAGTDRYSTTPGVTVVVDYTPGDGKAAMDALMSAVGEVRRQIEEER